MIHNVYGNCGRSPGFPQRKEYIDFYQPNVFVADGVLLMFLTIQRGQQWEGQGQNKRSSGCQKAVGRKEAAG